MRSSCSHLKHALVTLFAVVLAGGCAADVGTAAAGVPNPDSASVTPGSGSARTATLLSCEPAAAEQTTTALIGPLGGVLALGGTRVVIPIGAVLAPTSFRLTIPASRLVEIVVRAGDADHFLFEQPVVVSMDYSRCVTAIPAGRALSAWHIDEQTKALLENMSGVDARALNIITFSTGHLSGYAVAD